MNRDVALTAANTVDDAARRPGDVVTVFGICLAPGIISKRKEPTTDFRQTDTIEGSEGIVGCDQQKSVLPPISAGHPIATVLSSDLPTDFPDEPEERVIRSTVSPDLGNGTAGRQISGSLT